MPDAPMRRNPLSMRGLRTAETCGGGARRQSPGLFGQKLHIIYAYSMPAYGVNHSFT